MLCIHLVVITGQGINLVPRPPTQILSHSSEEKSGTFLHGCEIKSGREAWGYEVTLWHAKNCTSYPTVRYMYLDNDSPILFIFRNHVSGELLALLTDRGGNCRNKRRAWQLQVITEHLRKLLWGYQSLWEKINPTGTQTQLCMLSSCFC